MFRRVIPFVLILASCGGGSDGGEETDLASDELSWLTGLDEGFGQGGTVVFGSSETNEMGRGVAVQDDGKILVCGSITTATGLDTFVGRLNADGSPDLSFGTNGSVVFPVSSEDDTAFGIADQNGRIVVGGWAKLDGVTKVMFAWLSADGAPEETLIQEIGDTDQDAGIFRIAIQPDGKVVGVGNARFGGDSRIIVCRNNQDGSPDTSFGEAAGVASVVFDSEGTWGSGGKAITIDSEGRIVAGGWVRPGASTEDTDFAIVRLDPYGKLDATFHGTGWINVDFGLDADDHVYGLSLQDDKIIASGNALTESESYFAMSRFDDNGIDSSFGNDGRVLFDYAGATDDLADVVVRDEQIYACGAMLFYEVEDPTKIASSSFAVAAFDATGTLNTSFGSGGVLLTTIQGGLRNHSSRATLQEDGKLVQVGLTSSSLNSDMNIALARYR